MIRKFGDFSVQAKMASIVMAICGFLVLLMTSLFVFDKVSSFRRSMIETHTMLAETIAKNIMTSIVFIDATSAHETLSALQGVDDVVTATAYTSNGDIFANFTKNNSDKPPIPEASNVLIKTIQGDNTMMLAHRFTNDYLDLAVPILFENERIGYITMRADLQHLHNRLFFSIGVVIALIVTLAVSAQFISIRLHRFIAHPLLNLLETMEAVKEEKKYSYRVKQFHNDEFGMLTNGFNSMLAKIESRDEELEKHRNHLEELVSTRTDELLLANNKLTREIEERKSVQGQLARAQRMEAIGTLAGGVAHDLNNILSGIVTYPELLIMGISQDHEMYTPLKAIEQSGKKAAAIVQDLLTLARRGGITMELIDLENVVNDYLNSPECKNMLSLHPHVKVTKNFDVNLLMVNGSAVHLGKTVMNLITNAAEAIGPEDEGTITVKLENYYLDRPVTGYKKAVEGQYVKLTVSDTGHGISADDLQYIFEPFYTKKQMGVSGTGLGMAVVWGTVEDHRGYIDVASSPGEGAHFYLYFPATSEKKSPTVEEGLQQYRGKEESILVVDDVKDQRIIATAILRELGYKVEAVASGEEAIEYLQTHSADLLFLDMIMDPGIDGIETYRQVLQRNPRQRALLASGYSEASKLEIARRLGLTANLRKPYTIKGIAKIVRQELDQVDENSTTSPDIS